ncbi:tRNA (guanine-n(1)-)-methyltransferase [Alicycliphilus sp. B1]|nr:tRNA (guanine-n(1)-)-methyltransferase [Alicycliphilus sp. B1]
MGAVLLCGRYEGVDQRFIDAHVDVQVSLGDFVLSGGEIAAMALLDAVARLQPGVLHDDDSHQLDSFNPALDGLLDCPHYTRPEQWQGLGVPAPLLSGHHAQIERWRRDQRLLVTARHRPDLLEAARCAWPDHARRRRSLGAKPGIAIIVGSRSSGRPLRVHDTAVAMRRQ